MKDYIYIMSTPHPLKCKIGYSNRPDLRVKQIDRRAQEKVKLRFYLPFFFAYSIEQLIHFCLSPIRIKNQNHQIGTDGYTEWFWLNYLIGGCVLVFFWILHLVLIMALIFSVVFLVQVFYP